MQIIFTSLYFAVVGSQVDLMVTNQKANVLDNMLIFLAISTKIIGCGLSSMIFLKNKSKAQTVTAGDDY